MGVVAHRGHLQGFASTLQGKGVTAKHLGTTLRYIRDLNTACRFEKPLDFDAARVSAHVAELRRRGTGACSINARLTALKSFTRWLFRTERLRTDPMMQVPKLNAEVDRRHERRALTDEEVARLIQAAERGHTFHRLTGPDRAMLYRLAVETGLRAGELASLTPASFNLNDRGSATVTVAAAYSKHRREDVLPLRPDLANEMVAYVAARPATDRLFHVPHKSARMLSADLRQARALWIRETPDRAERRTRRASFFLTVHDASGRVVDFHALRHTFITRLARSGVAPAVAKTLARHSTIVLTMDHYTHTLIEDERAALDRLPALRLTSHSPKALAATSA
jgi:integrase